MTTIDLNHLRTWIGRTTDDDDVLNPRHAHLMAATLDQSPVPLQMGAPLPPLWHWLYFLQAAREFLPPSMGGRFEVGMVPFSTLWSTGKRKRGWNTCPTDSHARKRII